MRGIVILCALLVIVNARVRRDLTVSVKGQPNMLDSFKSNIDQFRKCLDESLSQAIGDVNEKQLLPVFNVIGDQINRFSKAFEDLTASSTAKPHDPDLEIQL